MVIEIQLSSSSVKYLEHYYAKQEDGTYSLKGNKPLNSLFFSLIKEGRVTQRPGIREASIKFYLGERNPNLGIDRRNSFYHMPEQNQKLMDNLISSMIKSEAYGYINGTLKNGGEIKSAINEFITNYKFETDNLTYEGLKKSYYRDKKRDNPSKQSVNALIMR